MYVWASASPRRRRATAAGLTSVLVAGLLTLGAAPAPAADPIHEAPAVVETTPSDEIGDSVDDPAIWVDPADPSRSVIIGADHADKGLSVYDLSGNRIHELRLSSANNVDIRPGFSLGGATVPVLGLAGSGDLSFYTLDPATRTLTNVTPGGDKIEGPALTRPGDATFVPHGICLYRSPVNHSFYTFVVDRYGTIKQFELTDGGHGKVALQEVREIKAQPRGTVGGDPDDALEGCVADEVGRSLFVGEQDWHIWRYGAEPTDPTGTADRVMVDKDVSEGGHFSRDVEGLTLVNDPAGGGYLIASSQGDYTYTVYRSTAPYEFVRKVKVTGSATSDGCERTDGIDAVAANLGPSFPQGIFVCQDNTNVAPAPGNMNFKFVRLEHVVPLGAGPAPSSTTTTVPAPPPAGGDPLPPGPAPDPGIQRPAPSRSGYWMLGSAGKVFSFGDAGHHGDAPVTRPARAVDLEPTPTGNGYWVIDDRGAVFAHGDAAYHGAPGAARLMRGEAATSLSATHTGAGYWIFTSLGRAFAFGDAPALGDMAGTRLNAPVLDSITTPSGRGYYMVAADGGIFSFGDARFYGSMGGVRLNQPVQSLVPDPDGTGYWLVAADGGVFSFQAGFRGSLGATRLNRPVTGMVAFGNGYLMVGEDGGIFNFSDKPFHGSLGASPPPDPITSVAALG
jgi:myo-inositol-hexaphosphate 3-phosphohydrolase